jgi:hypothetical protein
MRSIRDVCCKGHEYLSVAQGIKKRKRAQRAKEKREAKRREFEMIPMEDRRYFLRPRIKKNYQQ